MVVGKSHSDKDGLLIISLNVHSNAAGPSLAIYNLRSADHRGLIDMQCIEASINEYFPTKTAYATPISCETQME